MPFKTVLVHLDTDAQRDVRFEIAVDMVRKSDGHLIGIHPVEPPYLPPSLGELSGPIEAEVVEAQRRESADRVDRLRAWFESEQQRTGLNLEFRTEEGDPGAALVAQGRYSDVLIIGQGDEDSVFPDASMVERVILDGGCPVCVVPQQATGKTVSGTVVVAWNDSKEAAHAITAAMPLLMAAEKVIVLQVDSPRMDETQAEDKALQLGRLGVRCEAHHVGSSGRPIGEVLVSTIANLGADSVIMGAYGHTRLREWVLGGATRSILLKMPVPVIFAN